MTVCFADVHLIYQNFGLCLTSLYILQDSAFSAYTSNSEEPPKHNGPPPLSRKLRVLILASEWGCSEGGLSTINRELAINLAKCPEAHVTFFVARCNDMDKEAAGEHNIVLIKAARRPGYDNELEWLSFPPKDLQIDVVLGHGVELGHQAQVITNSHRCKWVQVVHTDPEELGMHRTCANPISSCQKKHDDEVELCKMADFVVTVGPKLNEAFRCYLRSCKKDEMVFDFTPGILSDVSKVTQVPREGKKFRVLLCGYENTEDFSVQGFDIAAKAVAALIDSHLLFIGAPEGKEEETKDFFLNCGIPAKNLTIRNPILNREKLKNVLCEVDLAVMPSRADGFGIAGLEALSAGLPILVSRNSGFGEALSKVPFGSFFVIDSDEAKVWTKAIKDIWDKDRKDRLFECETLRSFYKKKYSWEEQSKELLTKMISLVHGMNFCLNLIVLLIEVIRYL